MADKGDMLKRELDIQTMLNEGSSKSDILKTLSRKWGVSERSIDRQYARIINDIARLAAEDKMELRAKLLARTDHIYRKSLEEGRYKTALDASVAQAKIGGLHEKAEESHKLPEIIEIGVKDFSQPLKVVGESGGEE